jgi:large-conductance mechanosensitive channel
MLKEFKEFICVISRFSFAVILADFALFTSFVNVIIIPLSDYCLAMSILAISSSTFPEPLIKAWQKLKTLVHRP